MHLTTDHLRFYQQNQKLPSWASLIPKVESMQQVSIHTLIPGQPKWRKTDCHNSVALLKGHRNLMKHQHGALNLQQYMHDVIRRNHVTADVYIKHFKRWLRRMEA